MRSVAILGGGMGGLAAAHELVKLGMRVDVYEASDRVGGKAKSQISRWKRARRPRGSPGRARLSVLSAFLPARDRDDNELVSAVLRWLPRPSSESRRSPEAVTALLRWFSSLPGRKSESRDSVPPSFCGTSEVD